MIINPVHFIPRKISLNEESIFKNDSKYASKFDAYDPFINQNDNFSYNKSKGQSKKNSINYSNKRNKAYSINENYNFNNKFKKLETSVPLNKNYDLFDEKKSKNILNKSKILVVNKYSLKDIVRIYLNLNLMKKFELPDDIKINFIPEAMTNEPKKLLEHFKQKVQNRERAYTYNESYTRSIFRQF